MQAKELKLVSATGRRRYASNILRLRLKWTLETFPGARGFPRGCGKLRPRAGTLPFLFRM